MFQWSIQEYYQKDWYKPNICDKGRSGTLDRAEGLKVSEESGCAWDRVVSVGIFVLVGSSVLVGEVWMDVDR